MGFSKPPKVPNCIYEFKKIKKKHESVSVNCFYKPKETDTPRKEEPPGAKPPTLTEIVSFRHKK